MTDVLVEGFATDAVALARRLAADGAQVRLAGPDVASDEALALRSEGVLVDERVDLDADPGSPRIAYLDVWTPEVTGRVSRLRAAGSRLSCLSDYLVEHSPMPTLGVTGTAGKTTTTSFAAQLLRIAGQSVALSTSARAGNLWATDELLPAIADPGVELLALELTSSHLAFCRHSPTIAVVTCFWPDHIELHGSLEAYRAAKERIVAAQVAGDCVVVNEDDPIALSFAGRTPATASGFSTRREVARGAFLRAGRVIARSDGVEVDLGPGPERAGRRDTAAVAAVAAALACGVDPESLVGALALLEPLPYRARTVGHRGGAALVDDGMAATPTKTSATLQTYAPGSIVAVVGGLVELAGRAVGRSPAERRLLDDALAVVARSARLVVLFGQAGASVEEGLRGRGVPVVVEDDLGRAIDRALAAADGAAAVVVSPMFPLELAARRAIAERLTLSTW